MAVSSRHCHLSACHIRDGRLFSPFLLNQDSMHRRPLLALHCSEPISVGKKHENLCCSSTTLASSNHPTVELQLVIFGSLPTPSLALVLSSFSRVLCVSRHSPLQSHSHTQRQTHTSTRVHTLTLHPSLQQKKQQCVNKNQVAGLALVVPASSTSRQTSKPVARARASATPKLTASASSTSPARNGASCTLSS